MTVAIAWAAAIVVALVVLGFCGYELSWKSTRLRSELSRLQTLMSELTKVQAQLGVAQQRLARRPSGD